MNNFVAVNLKFQRVRWIPLVCIMCISLFTKQVGAESLRYAQTPPLDTEPLAQSHKQHVCISAFPDELSQPGASSPPSEQPPLPEEQRQLKLHAEETDAYERVNAAVKTRGLLVPLGDQLGDVGYYYSQVAPSISSSIVVTNITDLPQSLSLRLYEDTGLPVRELHGCLLSPRTRYTITAQNGELFFAGDENRSEAGQFCSQDHPLTQADTQSDAELRGIYHARIDTANPDVLDVAVVNQHDLAHREIAYHSESRYSPISDFSTGPTAALPAVVVTRQRTNWWDTEIVVENTSDKAAHLKFEFCNDEGRCFQNNGASLAGYERRSFLASHLAYEDDNGFLAERSGWFSAAVVATTLDADQPAPQIAVLSHIFSQPVAESKWAPQAEKGSYCFLTSTHSAGAFEQTFAHFSPNELFVRIFNADAGESMVTIHFLDEQERPLATVNQMLPQRASATFQFAEATNTISPFVLESARTMRIQSSRRFTSFVWQEGALLSPVASETGIRRWHIPFVGAPVVEFRWDNQDVLGRERQQTNFGLAETHWQNHRLRPEWARRMNWYNWRTFRDSCNETVSESQAYSTYINTWKGLGRCGPLLTDRSCVNSEERLQKVRNTVPSNCSARPLFLANEPDLTPQSFMTYHELGRMMYLFRDWPGQVFSPTFASFRYDAPTYIPEPNEWCTNAVETGICPGPSLCTQCIQDGVVDGLWDPNDISFQGLERYYSAADRWARGQQWPVESVIEGMNLHIYVNLDLLDPDNFWRATFIQQYRDRAAEANWPINVKEYGIATWRDRFGNTPLVTRCDVSRHVDDIRRLIIQNLGNNEEKYNYNPRKLFWFHTGCREGVLEDYEVLCLFDGPAELSSPVGQCWYEDAFRQDAEKFQCELPCSFNHLPLILGGEQPAENRFQEP